MDTMLPNMELDSVDERYFRQACADLREIEMMADEFGNSWYIERVQQAVSLLTRIFTEL